MKEQWIDEEWETARRADEQESYYWIRRELFCITMEGKEIYQKNYIKCYKPSVARLLYQRTGWKIENLITGEVIL